MFLPEENIPGKDRVVFLSHSLWRNRFNGDSRIIGSTVTLDGVPFTVIGVMTPMFQFPSPKVEVWVPISLVTEDAIPHRRGIRWMNVVARLKPGQSIESAQTATTVVLRRLEQEYRDTNTGWGVSVVQGLQESLVGKVEPALKILMAAVALVLLIACANLANLVLARGTSRVREVAIRTAMGAGRRRLAVQFVRESVLLALLGGIAAFFFASWAIDLLLALSAGTIPRLDEIRIDRTVVAFGVGLSILTGILFGLVPAIKLTGREPQFALKESGAATSESSRKHRLRSTLVVGEISIACVLLAASGLVINSLWRLVTTYPGFQTKNVLVVGLNMPLHQYPGIPNMTSYREELLRRIESLPGVIAVGASKTMPLHGGGEPYRFSIQGRPEGPIEVYPRSGVYIVTSGYFRALGIPLVSGRVFDERDFAQRRPVLVINQALARLYWSSEDPVGKFLNIGNARLQIIGVAGDVRNEGLSSEAGAAIYAPMSLFPRAKLVVFIRTSRDPLAMAAPVRQAIRAFEGEQPIQEMAPLEQVVTETVAQPRFLTIVLTLFGGVALLLAAVGTFGVISYNVRERTHEIGIRMALGAKTGDILRLTLSSGLRLTAIGLLFGLIGALISSRALETLLYGVSPRDPLTLLAIALLLGAVALLATYIPARRATKVDPMVACRLLRWKSRIVCWRFGINELALRPQIPSHSPIRNIFTIAITITFSRMSPRLTEIRHL